PPDFPTPGLVLPKSRIRPAYQTARRSIQIPSPPVIEERAARRQPILLTQIPFQVNNPPIIQKIPHLLPHNKIHPIT
ncbi:hypothetical protein, partial [Staphylococcus aureus]|uniref:hypothetical protein n=1 Tax=Staphylococcus aureus TaxID=1280 RepID=UPI0011A43FD7